jgi:hypothetical protein
MLTIKLFRELHSHTSYTAGGMNQYSTVKYGTTLRVRFDFLRTTVDYLTLSNSRGYIVLNGKNTVNDILDRILKEAVMAHFKVLSQHLHGRTEQNYKELQNSCSLS